MPRAGGESDKFGNQFEAAWTVEVALDVFKGTFKSLIVEPFGEESLGIEFIAETTNGHPQFHSVKRQKQGGDWSIADLCRPDKSTGRSILGDLFGKRETHPTAEFRIVSSTGANELRELSEKASAFQTAADFASKLPMGLRAKFDEKIIPICNGDKESAFAALINLEVILVSQNILTRSVERRIDELFLRTDGSALNPGDVRRLIAEFAHEKLGSRIDSDRLRELFRTNGIGVRDCKTERAVNDTVAAVNKRYRSVAEAELINSAQISRDVVAKIIDSLAHADSKGALLVAPGGFGKSCVLVQCLKSLEESGTPYLCLRMDSFDPCNTTRQLGEQLDLQRSPAIVLAGIADNAPSILIVDQLDAISLVSGRSPRMWEVFSELCEEVRSYPRMKMIVACRDFDLNHDRRLKTLGHEQSGFLRFQLEKLTKTEVHASLELAKIAISLSDRQAEILGSPFHLLLFMEGDPSRGFSSVGELYDRYWDRKRQKVRDRLGREAHWNQVIDALTQRMSEYEVLHAPKVVCDDWSEDAQAMASEHVLVDAPNQSQYYFFHESFFDYAYARRFFATGRGVVEFLASSEQHLFRRAQVRQILAYRREHEFKKYVTDVGEIFKSPNVRLHIKRMVASDLKRLDRPEPEEWRLVEPYLLDGDLSRYISPALRNHVGWFDLLDSLQVFQDWLASDDSRLKNAAIWFLEAHQLHDTRSSRIAEVIAPYAKTDEPECKERILRVMSWGIAHKCKKMSAIYLDLIARGAYDDYKSAAAGGDFWSRLYEAQKECPKFIIDVLATWFDVSG